MSFHGRRGGIPAHVAADCRRLRRLDPDVTLTALAARFGVRSTTALRRALKDAPICSGCDGIERVLRMRGPVMVGLCPCGEVLYRNGANDARPETAS